jgi:hypothetical protein
MFFLATLRYVNSANEEKRTYIIRLNYEDVIVEANKKEASMASFGLKCLEISIDKMTAEQYKMLTIDFIENKHNLH